MLLIIGEVAEGVLKKNTGELITAAQTIAQGAPIGLALLGATAAAAASAATALPVATIFTFSDPALEPYTVETRVAALADFCKARDVTVVIAGQTLEARDWMPRLAARLGGAMVPDITGLVLEGSTVVITRPVLSGKGIATVVPAASPLLLTIRANAFPPATGTGSATIEAVSTSLAAATRKILEVAASTGSGKVELSEAEIVVSGGRGIKGPENWGPLQDLADALGAALGASRAVVDAGWIEHAHQVGQTGKTVSPKLYVAVGISGAIQHLAGMSSSKYI
ncbi:MAG: electron transfer flavoprotein subunit alpha/FixB family protein, partial [bacterium]